MRYVWHGLAAGMFFLLVGCTLPWTRTRPGDNAAPPPQNAHLPTAAALVGYLNDNARRIQTVDCRELDLDAKQKLQAVGLSGWMVCQKPRNFRLGANVAGSQMVDLGSNDREFWFWISKAEPPYLFHCSYDDFARGSAQMPFPFQPEWIIEALGIAECRAPENYQVVPQGNTLQLIEQSVSAQGKPVRKIVVFNRHTVQPPQPQVMAYILQDASGKEVCGAYITEVAQDRATLAILPRRIRLVWPEEKMELRMKLDQVTVNGTIAPERSARLFTRPTLANVPSYDLARGLDPAPGALRRTSGWMR
jgi:hypothetical protein